MSFVTYEPIQVAQPRTWLEVLWDAIRNFFVTVIYALIDGIVTIVKRFVWDAVYGTWCEE